MAWKECDRVSQRKEFAVLAAVEGVNFAELCRRFDISRKTGYKWRKRFLEDPEAAMADHSRRPKSSPGKTIAEVEQHVLQIRDAHSAWGGLKIRKRLQTLGQQGVPSASTIAAILKRHGRVREEESQKRKPFCRFERAAPNELWQEDFQHSDRYQVRRVNPVRQMSLRGKVDRASEAFPDQPHGLGEPQTDGVWDVSYCRFMVACLIERSETIERHEPRGWRSVRRKARL